MSKNKTKDSTPADGVTNAELENNEAGSVPTVSKAAYYSLGVLTVVYSFNFIDRQLLAILQESIKADLNLKDAHLGLLTGFAFAVFYVTAGIPIARWADRANRRNIVAASVFIWSFMTSISGLAQNFYHLLLARIGVGIGEAGGSPPSHSIVSDLFPPQKRATALGFYSTGVNIGILFGFLLGGWLNEFFGWRVAFAVVGLPGIILAIIVRFTVAEPERGGSDIGHSGASSSTFSEVVSLLWSRRAFRYMALGGAFNAFAGYAMANWTASFMIRTHGMATGELGTWLALILGVGGAFGVVGGGYISDKLSKRDKRWYMWVPMLAVLAGAPFTAFAYTVDDQYVALLAMFVPGIVLNAYLGNLIAMTPILFFILNIIGMGLGPWSVGALSDYLTPSLQSEALGMAMFYIVAPVMCLSGVCFYIASRYLRVDLENAPK